MTNDKMDTKKPIYWSDEFEAGRQEVIAQLEETVSRHLRFIVSLREETKGMAYSKEKRDGIEIGYGEIIQSISILKTKRININLIA